MVATTHFGFRKITVARRDPQDGKVGLVGYEINFNRYFYEYRPPRPLEEIEADIRQVEKERGVLVFVPWLNKNAYKHLCLPTFQDDSVRTARLVCGS